MSGSPLTTVFRFTCATCREPNEHHQTHAAHVRPQLVSVRCSSCQSYNWLGGLRGTLLERGPREVRGNSPTMH